MILIPPAITLPGPTVESIHSSSVAITQFASLKAPPLNPPKNPKK